jgi:heat shock protein HtpX
MARRGVDSVLVCLSAGHSSIRKDRINRFALPAPVFFYGEGVIPSGEWARSWENGIYFTGIGQKSVYVFCFKSARFPGAGFHGWSKRIHVPKVLGFGSIVKWRVDMFRVVLFLATNLAIMVLLGLVLSILGVDSRSTSGLLVMAALFGMGGSFISLAMSKWIAKKSTGAQVIVTPNNPTEQWLYGTVRRMAEKAGIGMPEIAIYDSPDLNAFATGMKKNNALVAVSTGLLQNMSKDEVEAVLAHEITHVACGDMVTLALVQGVLNTFVILLSRLAANVINNFLSSDEEGEGLGFFGYMAVTMVLEIVFGLFASIIVMWFSRKREYTADQGAAYLVGKEKMVSALQRLQVHHEPSHLPDQVAAFGIRPKAGGIAELFRSHPPLEDRIAALQKL